MRIISRKAPKEFWELHRDAEQPLRAWYADTRRANWTKPTDITDMCSNGGPIPNSRAVFDIKDNAYRLVVAINYGYGVVYIRFVGTHDEYARIDTTTI